MKDYNFWVYILFDERAKATYIGVTNDLQRRMYEHKMGRVDGFTKDKNIHKLGYFECYKYIDKAVAREKQLKKWKRAWKYRLIETMNPNWIDLADSLEQNIAYWKNKEIS
ncbi:MAG: GIY-YIG nuclease family protein [Alphaproteobacteria bacterium]|nr:GIY-YIG nuclease family protein [Alphaproteobacteria bacterium]